jgi:hypothetical protein
MRRATIPCALATSLLTVLSSAAVAHAQLTGSWGSIAKEPVPGTFAELVDVDVDPRGYVYTLDDLPPGGGRVQKFTADGKLVRQFGVPADPDDRYDADEIVDAIDQPAAIAVGPDRNVYVAEDGTRTRISVWSPLGKYLRSFGAGGSADGQFSSPAEINFDSSTGNLVVADSGNDRFGFFTVEGTWVRALDTSPLNGYRLTGSASIGGTLFIGRGGQVAAVTATGVSYFGGPTETGDPILDTVSDIAAAGETLYVSDQRRSQVFTFDAAGGLTGNLGTSPGSQPGQFVGPVAVATGCGSVYVADAGNHRIQRFAAPAPACGDVSKDPEERMVVKLGGPKKLRFRKAFAVTPVVNCDRPCTGVLRGTIKIRGRRKPIRLTSERIVREFPGDAVSNIAPTERGTDKVVAALERRKKLVARITLVARDLTGRKVVRKRSYRLR